MSPRRLKSFGILLLAASLLGLAVSIPVMAQRLSNRPDLKNRPLVWFGEPIYNESFTYRGEPVRVETVTTDNGGKALDQPVVVVHWRGQQAKFEVVGGTEGAAGNSVEGAGRDDPRLPELLRHEDWLKIMPMAIAHASSNAEVDAQIAEGKVAPRLIAAARYPAEGYNAGSWGLVRRRDWQYRFAEFLTDGPAESSIRTSESTYAELERAVAPGPYDKPLALTDEQMTEKLWQHGAMLQVTPTTLYRARDKQVQQGLHAMGWTWPVAGASFLALVAGLGLIAISTLPRR